MTTIGLDVIAEWEKLGIESRFAIFGMGPGGVTIHSVGAMNKGYAQFLNSFDEKRCLWGGFAFENPVLGRDPEEDVPSTFKVVLVKWKGCEASQADLSASATIEAKLVDDLTTSKCPVALQVDATTKKDVDYCTILDQVAPPLIGDNDEGGYDDGGYTGDANDDGFCEDDGEGEVVDLSVQGSRSGA
mmetsp:Transcript_146776/g.256315  ORF Transcript_146776/g.256315 Transcript_146776/m.256315 type:complete len:187 (-) Transcript_146776:22-582(-)